MPRPPLMSTPCRAVANSDFLHNRLVKREAERRAAEREAQAQNDKAIALYREEKARRAGRVNEPMQRAKAAFRQLMADTKPGKQGRPRGSKNHAWQTA